MAARARACTVAGNGRIEEQVSAKRYELRSWWRRIGGCKEHRIERVLIEDGRRSCRPRPGSGHSCNAERSLEVADRSGERPELTGNEAEPVEPIEGAGNAERHRGTLEACAHRISGRTVAP